MPMVRALDAVRFALIKSKSRYVSKIQLRYVKLVRYDFIPKYVICKFGTYRNVLLSFLFRSKTTLFMNEFFKLK